MSALAPGFELQLAYHLTQRLSLTFSAGLNFGNSNAKTAGAATEDKVHFQVVPLTLGVRYDTWRPTPAVLIYSGAGIGVGFVRTALQGAHDLSGAFTADVNAGMLYAFARRWRFITELDYGITTDTPSAVRSQPLNALKVAVGAGFVF